MKTRVDDMRSSLWPSDLELFKLHERLESSVRRKCICCGCRPGPSRLMRIRLFNLRGENFCAECLGWLIRVFKALEVEG